MVLYLKLIDDTAGFGTGTVIGFGTGTFARPAVRRICRHLHRGVKHLLFLRQRNRQKVGRMFLLAGFKRITVINGKLPSGPCLFGPVLRADRLRIQFLQQCGGIFRAVGAANDLGDAGAFVYRVV